MSLSLTMAKCALDKIHKSMFRKITHASGELKFISALQFPEVHGLSP